MKKFINDSYDVVDEMVEGFLQVHAKYVRKLDGVRTLVRQDAPVEGKVGLVSGGGSGHKPSFIGFIGRGMLDAVAAGEIFTSPPPNACFEAAKAVHSGNGMLFLLGNYAGDVMNFQMATDMARAQGIEVEQCISTDDVASAPKGQEDRRRGVVGSVLCWKVAGAKADAGGSVQECKVVVDRVNANTRTIGVALAPCTVPAKGTPTFTLADDEIEYGVGHHGEAGTEKAKMAPVDEIVERMTNEIIADLPFSSGDDVLLMINGLGGTPQIELYLAYRKARQIAEAAGLKVDISLVGEFFTGLEMAGFSVTLTHLDDELTSLIKAPADTCMFKVV
ncbi:MAG: dihydroxyacetone kinase subunit DhaK [Desulfobacteraceae bacterium]|jgi:dihydroxyacetone kinase-like protein|nr:dihydroxyacetone kinase subunit DhaK [Desulfobacteraceae bacterium]